MFVYNVITNKRNYLIGWDGNAEKQNQGLTMAPVAEQKMSR